MDYILNPLCVHSADREIDLLTPINPHHTSNVTTLLNVHHSTRFL